MVQPLCRLLRGYQGPRYLLLPASHKDGSIFLETNGKRPKLPMKLHCQMLAHNLKCHHREITPRIKKNHAEFADKPIFMISIDFTSISHGSSSPPSNGRLNTYLPYYCFIFNRRTLSTNVAHFSEI
jgi:hypothetical protein